MGADPSLREWLERDRGLLRWIVRTAPAAFWIAARQLQVDNDRIVVPGGAAAEPLWEALVAVKVTRPADFLRALLARDSGRLAWFYDSIGAMPPDRMAAAFGAPPIEAQIEQARAFYDAFRSADSNWRLEEHPFLRGTTDPWIVASQIGLDGTVVAPPAAQWLWEALFDRAEIERQVSLHNLDSHVLLTGRATDQDLHAWYEAAAVFVHPTRYEGSSLVTLEAMAHRLPVIATVAGGLPDKVHPGVNGWLVDPDDVQGLADALTEASTDPTRLVTMGQQSREIVEREFSWPVLVDRYVQLYSDLITSRRSPKKRSH